MTEDQRYQTIHPQMSDLSSSLNFADVIRANMNEQNRVRPADLGQLADLPKGTISGVARQLLFQSLLKKTTMKRSMEMARENTESEHQQCIPCTY